MDDIYYHSNTEWVTPKTKGKITTYLRIPINFWYSFKLNFYWQNTWNWMLDDEVDVTVHIQVEKNNKNITETGYLYIVNDFKDHTEKGKK